MSWWRGLVASRSDPFRGLTGEARSRPGVTVAGGPRGPIGYGRGPRALHRAILVKNYYMPGVGRLRLDGRFTALCLQDARAGQPLARGPCNTSGPRAKGTGRTRNLKHSWLAWEWDGGLRL